MPAHAAYVLSIALALATGKPQPQFQIYFFTADWCAPCRAIYPVLEKYQKKEPDCLAVTSIDFDKARDAAAQSGVETIPVVIGTEAGGRIVFRIDGGGREQLRSLDSALAETVRRCRARR